MRLNEEIVKSGYFWLPQQEDNKVIGTLSIVNGGDISLEILGLLGNENQEDFQLKRIVGVIEDGEKVTLEDCFYTKRACSFGFTIDTLQKSNIHVNKAYLGEIYIKEGTPVFTSFQFTVDCIDEWVGITGIKVDHDRNNKTTTVTYEPKNPLRYNLQDDWEIEIGFSYELPSSSITEAKITHKSCFCIISNSAKPISEFIAIANKLTNFMSFAIDDTVAISEVKAFCYNTSNKQSNSLKVYYPSLSFLEKIPDKHWHNMLFHFGIVKDNFESVINNWFKAYDVITPALNLYFSTKIKAQKYIDGRFLALAQGLETYDRRTNNDKLMDENVFDDLKEEILGNCPSEHVKWLKGRLMHGNEISFRKRLQNIIKPFESHIGSPKEIKSLINKIIDNRNYLTHYSVELKDKTATGEGFYMLCIQMEIIFQLHLLKDLGFNEREIEMLIKDCYPLKNKIDYIKEQKSK